MRLALFDIDGTLVPGRGSEPRFAGYLWRHRRLGPRQIASYAAYAVTHVPRYGRAVMQKNKAYLSGLAVSDVAAWGRQFVDSVLAPLLFQPAVARLHAHMEAGDRVFLLSGTPQFIVDPLVRALDADGGYGALAATRDGVFRALTPPRHPYGPTKVAIAGDIAEATGLPLDSAIAYGDSISDAYLFRAVGHSVAVMPDRRLRAMAIGEGWELLGCD